MKLSELIHQLKLVRQEHGDIDVMAVGGGMYDETHEPACVAVYKRDELRYPPDNKRELPEIYAVIAT